jgi:pimeloyl-ACP methyl ester carboxylesterase
MKELSAQVCQVRPGRELFVRRTLIGTHTSADNSIQPPAAKASFQLLMVHGLCATEAQFLPMLQALDRLLQENSNSHNTITMDCWGYDWMGCGQSPRKPNATDYSKEETVADLEGIFQLLDATQPTIVMGHSYGPSILLAALHDSPFNNCIKGTILLCTAIYTDSTSRYLTNGGHPIMKLPLCLLHCLQPLLTNSFIQLAVHPQHTQLADQIRKDSNTNDMHVAKSYHQSMHWATEDHLPPLNGSTRSYLVIHGSHDGAIPVQAGQELANRLQAPFVVIEDASHLVMLEQPEQTARVVLEFIKSLV